MGEYFYVAILRGDVDNVNVFFFCDVLLFEEIVSVGDYETLLLDD